MNFFNDTATQKVVSDLVAVAAEEVKAITDHACPHGFESSRDRAVRHLRAALNLLEE